MVDFFNWSEENIAKLKRCIDEKLSSAATAVLLGCSRNTVMGKASRLGLTFQSVSRKNVSRTRAAEETLALPPAAPVVEETVPTPWDVLPEIRPVEEDEIVVAEPEIQHKDAPGLTFEQLGPAHCRAILAQDGPARYCGEPIASDRFSFCRAHMDKYLTTPSKGRARLAAEREARKEDEQKRLGRWS